MEVDPVCRMQVEPAQAAAKAEHAGRTYYFCSVICQKSFVADPQKYNGESAPADRSCCGGGKH